jgi:hypothetical protein
MICGRSALLLLAACILLSRASCAAQTAHDSADRTHSAVETQARPSSVCPCVARPGGGAVISRFTPWKSRIKSVVEESNSTSMEERDLGPAVFPGRPFILGIFLPVICTLATFPPLRC